MQTIITASIILAVIAAGTFIYVAINKKMASLMEFLERNKNDQGLLMLNQNLQGMQERIDRTTESINSRLDKAAHVISGVSKELGMVQEMGRSMKDLQDFLRSPKLRGNIGEQVLRDLLEQCFSRGHFDMQYQFKTGERVDAIIKTDKGIIPIDSKFPMENFQKAMKAENEEEKNKFFHEFAKDIRKHIDSISKKYILPGEGTVDFAVMYVPSEAVYYEVVRHSEDINNYAYTKKVFPVSPNSFYYFLKVIMIGLEGKKVEEAAQQILQTLSAIKSDNDKFSRHLGVLTSHVTHAKASIDTVNNEYAKLSSKIDNVRLLKE
ncbi:MAG: DNA recombination protein RmuC [bacterium]